MTELARTKTSISYARGGDLASISFENDNSLYSGSPQRKGGGPRGEIQVFSRASRLRLLRSLARIDRKSFRSSNGRMISVTLTYPREWPAEPGACKDHLEKFHKRLVRQYGEFGAFWRLGIQDRGAWHFHLLLFVSPSFGSVEKLREFIALAWYEVCGRISEDHLKAGTHVKKLKRWGGVVSYAERYMARPEQFPAVQNLGRVWGVWKAHLLFDELTPLTVSESDAYKIRRIFRRLSGQRSTGNLRKLTVFVRHENLFRLLEYLGYSLE